MRSQSAKKIVSIAVSLFFLFLIPTSSQAEPTLPPIDHPVSSECMDSYLAAYKKLPANPWKDYYYNPDTGEKTINVSVSIDWNEKDPNTIYYRKLKCSNEPFMNMSDQDIVSYFQQLSDRFNSLEVQESIKRLDDQYAMNIYKTKTRLRSLLDSIKKTDPRIKSQYSLLKKAKKYKNKKLRKRKTKRIRSQITKLKKYRRGLVSSTIVLGQRINNFQSLYAKELVPLVSIQTPNRINLIREFIGAYGLIMIYRLSKGTFNSISEKVTVETWNTIGNISFYAPIGPLQGFNDGTCCG